LSTGTNYIYQFLNQGDHYIADVVAYAVESSSSLGPLTIYGLKLFGIYER